MDRSLVKNLKLVRTQPPHVTYAGRRGGLELCYSVGELIDTGTGYTQTSLQTTAYASCFTLAIHMYHTLAKLL